MFTTRDDDSVRTFVANAAPGSSEYDVSWLFAHEMGHCVGLGDQESSNLEESLA